MAVATSNRYGVIRAKVNTAGDITAGQLAAIVDTTGCMGAGDEAGADEKHRRSASLPRPVIR
jgi:hypothetical protein